MSTKYLTLLACYVISLRIPWETEDLVSLGRELAALRRELAAAEKKSDGRNAHVRSLKKRMAAVTEQMADLDQIAVLTRPAMEMPVSNPNSAHAASHSRSEQK